MTDEQWAMVQKTPEWAFEREAHKKAKNKRFQQLAAKQRKRYDAIHARYERDLAAHKAKLAEEVNEFEEWSNDLENKGIARVFAKYGLEPGR